MFVAVWWWWWWRVSDDNGLAGFCLWLLGGFESAGCSKFRWLLGWFFKFQWLLLGVYLSFGCWGFVRGGGGWFCSRSFGCCSTLILGWVLELNQRLWWWVMRCFWVWIGIRCCGGGWCDWVARQCRNGALFFIWTLDVDVLFGLFWRKR